MAVILGKTCFNSTNRIKTAVSYCVKLMDATTLYSYRPVDNFEFTDYAVYRGMVGWL
jgi:hypothetical protein